jgi:hypothetical protein
MADQHYYARSNQLRGLAAIAIMTVMSFDLGVWSSQSRVSPQSAGRVYESLCRGEHPSELMASPGLDAFYNAVADQGPELGNIVTDHSDRHVLLSCDWAKAEDVLQKAQDLAQRYRLTLYDPQSDEVYYPG